jgi:hypothetical protein
MAWQVDWRRVATGSVVLVLHLLILLALLMTTGVVPMRIGTAPEIILTLPTPPKPKNKETLPQPSVPENIPVPHYIFPTYTLPPALAVPPPQKKQETTPEGDIRGFGRYLFNCSGEYYEELTEQEKEHCLRNRFGKPSEEKPPLLGTAKPSEFDKVIEERNAPFVPAFQGCDPSSINASLHNVPCMNTQNSHSILNEVPDH